LLYLAIKFILIMRIAERQWKFGTLSYYTDVEPEWLEFAPNIRVLPAKYFYEKSSCRLFFVAKYQPGENKWLPDGGFHLRDATGANRWFELDEVIIHPSIIQQQKLKDKLEKKAAKVKEKYNKDQRRKERKEGKRGRPALSDEDKALRIQEAQQRSERSGGRRGRPPKNPDAPKQVYVPRGDTGKKRGRKPLSPEEKASRIQVQETKQQRSGGKRGRPSDPAKKAERLLIQQQRLERNPERKRGRPKTK
jgi:hypothetical protein